MVYCVKLYYLLQKQKLNLVIYIFVQQLKRNWASADITTVPFNIPVQDCNHYLDFQLNEKYLLKRNSSENGLTRTVWERHSMKELAVHCFYSIFYYILKDNRPIFVHSAFTENNFCPKNHKLYFDWGQNRVRIISCENVFF